MIRLTRPGDLRRDHCHLQMLSSHLFALPNHIPMSWPSAERMLKREPRRLRKNKLAKRKIVTLSSQMLKSRRLKEKQNALSLSMIPVLLL